MSENLSGISRRRILQALALAALPIPAGWTLAKPGEWQNVDGSAPDLLLSSVKDRSQQNWWQASMPSGELLWRFPLPGRGHAIAVREDGLQAALVGRRPADWLMVADWTFSNHNRHYDQTRQTDPRSGRTLSLTGKESSTRNEPFTRNESTTKKEPVIRNEPVIRKVSAINGRHFYGHATYSPDGKYLFTTENDYQTGAGCIGIYDTGSLEQLGEWSSGGIGPHELKMMPDGNHLAIANGGILTHPDQPRKKLNPETMNPNLTLLDIRTGAVQEQHRLPEKKMSIRHLDIDPDGTVWVGCQYQGELLDPLPLVAFLSRDKGLQWVTGERDDWRRLNGYCGSICCHPKQAITAVSSPRGSHVMLWDNRQRRLLRSFQIKDVCGLAPLPENGFVATSGKGKAFLLDKHKTSPMLLFSESIAWDNHLLVG